MFDLFFIFRYGLINCNIVFVFLSFTYIYIPVGGGSTSTGAAGECSAGDPLLPVPGDCNAYMECDPTVIKFKIGFELKEGVKKTSTFC